MSVCVYLHVHLCMNVREYTCTYTHWDHRLIPSIFIYFSWFNFMRQSLSLNWQEYQTRRPKDPFTFIPVIGWQAPATKLAFIQWCGDQNSCPLRMWHFTTIFTTPIYLFLFYKNMCPLFHLNIVLNTKHAGTNQMKLTFTKMKYYTKIDTDLITRALQRYKIISGSK